MLRHTANRMNTVLSGRALTAADDEFKDVRCGFYSQTDPLPQLVVLCKNEKDIAHCLSVARQERLAFAIRSGGHSIAGFSSCQDMVIDVSALNSIRIDAAQETVCVGAGARLEAIVSALDAHGLHIPVGTCGTVGIAGFMQGGGYGYTSRSYGMNCDLVLEFRMMLANGEIVTANRQQHADLFWAVRGGGGGNFGVLLDVIYQAQQLDRVWAFAFEWPWRQAAGSLQQILDFSHQLNRNRELGYMANICKKSGEPRLLIQGMCTLGRSRGLDCLASIPAMSRTELVVDEVGSFGEMNLLLDDKPYPVPEITPAFAGKRYDIIKESGYIETSLTEKTWQAVLDEFSAQPQPWNMIVIEPYGGSIRSFESSHCAFTHRDVCANVYSNVFYQKETQQEEATQASRRIHDSLRAHMNGHRYPNYPQRGLKNFGWVYWGDAYQRLVEVKNRYDSEHFFRFPQSIGTLID